jgi:AhpD family alkylhydroperoxidase
MRLSILDRGHDLRTKALLKVIGLMSRHPVVDAVKLALYRPDFYRSGPLTQEAMRGPSDWSVADRELMAAFVSKVNGTEFCILAHTATSALAYGDEATVTAVLADLDQGVGVTYSSAGRLLGVGSSGR